MASRALTGHPGVVHLGRSEGHEILVTVIAGRRSRNVCRILAERIGTIMTTCTATGSDGAVIVGHRPPGGRRMASIAGLAGQNMCRRLGPRIEHRITARMASRTLSCRTCMTHARRSESSEGGVTGIAGSIGRDMRTRLGQSLVRSPVMAGGAAGVVADSHWRRQQGMVLGRSCP